MCNSIFIGKQTLPKAKDGEEFEMTIKGVYRTDEDGDRKLDVMEIDGDPVAEPVEAETPCSREELINQSSDDALQMFIVKTRKK